MVLRNLFTVLGIVAVFGVFFFVINPDWIKHIASNQPPVGQGLATKVNARLAGDRLRQSELPKEKGGFLHVDESTGADVAQKIVEDVGEDVPSRNSPYLLVINKSTNSLRYCRLGSGVRKVQLKLAYPDVKLQEVPTTPGGPYQAIIWIPQAMDLQLEFDVALTSAARS